MTWSVSGSAPGGPDVPPPSWIRVLDGAPTREDALAWIRRHGDEYRFYAVSMQPQPPGRPVDKHHAWEIFEVIDSGDVVSTRDGRRV
jgi:hypothetical protein